MRIWEEVYDKLQKTLHKTKGEFCLFFAGTKSLNTKRQIHVDVKSCQKLSRFNSFWHQSVRYNLYLCYLRKHNADVMCANSTFLSAVPAAMHRHDDWKLHISIFSIICWLRQELKEYKCPSVCAAQTFPEHSIFIILDQIFKQSLKGLKAVFKVVESLIVMKK